MELIESQPLLEWLANNYKMFGATLEIITDKSQEGSQFVRGFGGIGGKYSGYIDPLNYPPAVDVDDLKRYNCDIQTLYLYLHSFSP